MQNVHTLHSVHLPLRLPTAPQTPLLTTSPDVALHTVHRTNGTNLTLTSQPLPPSNVAATSVPLQTAVPTSPTALTSFADNLLVTLRTGEIHSIHASSRASAPSSQVIGEVVDVDPTRSGIIAAVASPDGNLLALVSPLSLTLLDASFANLAELRHPQLATHAALSWRSDGDFLALVFRSINDRVHGLVIDRACENVVNLDIDDQLSSELAVVIEWEPRVGGFIAVAGPGPAVTFFERNGERHRRSDFNIFANGTPKLMRWSPDCKYLAIAAEEHDDQAEGDAWRVAFYSRINYRWYCKKRVVLQHRVIALCWDEDRIGDISIVTEHDVTNLSLRTVSSTIAMSEKSAVAIVTDGQRVELTDFSKAIVPPPLSHGLIECGEDVLDVCAMRHGEGIAMLRSDGVLEWVVFEHCFDGVRVSGAPDQLANCLRGRISLAPSDDDPIALSCLRMPIMPSRTCAVVVASASPWSDRTAGMPDDALYLHHVQEGWGECNRPCRFVIDGRVTALGHSSEEMALVLTTSAGVLMRVVVDEFSRRFAEVARAANVSMNVISVHEVRTGRGRALTLLLDEDGRLDVVELASTRRLTVSKECTSFCVHEGFLIFTTRSHLLYCVLLDTKSALSNSVNKEAVPSIMDILDSAEQFPRLAEGQGATRPIDRGSLIVTPLPAKTDVVLQAPRGNLETISPRPVVFEVVDRFAKNGQYGKAFELCRRQRVDMNHIVDADYNGFLDNVGEFVDQVGQASHLSVFMTFLQGDAEKINAVCDAIVQTLCKAEDRRKYTTAILTGLVRREPSNVSGALEQVKLAHERDVDEGSAAVDFLFVLMKDENKVYEEALGMYDLALTAFVGESSQMDPAEYSQELHKLRTMPENEKRYSIDMRLKRFDKALQHLFECGESRFDECVKLCHEHALYATALPLFADRDAIRGDLLNGYGNHLRDSGDYDMAAAAFLQNGEWKLASECYQMGSRWELAIQAIGKCSGLSEEEKREMYVNIGDDLADAGRVLESGRIRASLVGDIEGALEVLSGAGEWDAAFEAVSVYEVNKKDGAEGGVEDVWGMMRNLVLEGAENLRAMIRENTSKLRERGNRLATLRESAKKLRESMGRGDGAEEGDSDVFSATSASSLGSNLSDVTFTSKGSMKTSSTSLYSSVAGSGYNGVLSSAKLDKQMMKRQQRMSKKRIREGHPKEQEYLVGYLKKLIPGDFVIQRVRKTARALVFVGAVDICRRVFDEVAGLCDVCMGLSDDVVSEEVRTLLGERAWADGVDKLAVIDRSGHRH